MAPLAGALTNPLAEDLDCVLGATRELWEELRGGKLFITGGTGFFGAWLLESFAWANRALELNSSATVLTRDPGAFLRKAPHFASEPAIKFHEGDVRTFSFPSGQFSHVIHGATESSAVPGHQSPLLMLDTIVAGTRRCLDFAAACGARKLLLTSSGAVYGKQPSDVTHVSEDFRGGPDPLHPGSSYGEGKRVAELQCVLMGRAHELEVKIARCFAFVGPYMKLDAHFAIGNFIRDQLNGGPIVVSGSGAPFRSYLYAADLMIWLWTILFRGAPGRAYNVGSENAISISELAKQVARALEPRVEVEIRGNPVPGSLAERYVPSTARARAELGLLETVSICDAIRKTRVWFQQRRRS
jgi:dTDP-glucose 4,6-dehydratase